MGGLFHQDHPLARPARNQRRLQPGNAATRGGGVDNAGSLILDQATLTENSADEGGGIRNLGTLALTNSIVAGKPNVLGGTRHHEDAAAQGLRIVFELAAKHFGLGTERTGPSVIIEGAGFVGGG